ncbi:hypothetical protein HQ346_14755 [Rhodococcus sp. BP-252]|uniref:EcsC protein family protein n=1 Tax=Rhodococcoides kyotonense TaxID=398843 RepID=A0A177YAM3_9NOCA|nr:MULTISPECIES: hypothetical protein [Rhodococcus]NIL78046.1 hypothetical protein [Rhodococcus sp. B10]MBY6411606.1 hypothetical protein [Rhodococcus sp. BP-320]MBY6417988.1 hypothetical protein [Rhodococcus sp. BP-321]MBY6422111.1 hypothetical protein [Rhodococcus sp. BP-324]MBY6427786.1 hypothetical protein [Rhodococcus sp. BP-323]
MASKKNDQVDVIKEGGRVEKALVGILDNASRLQGPAVEKYVAHMRRQHPNDTPAQLIERLENRFLLAVTGSGSAVGGAAAVPAIGTIASLTAVGAETAFFIESSALLTLSVASVHGIPVHDHQQRRALVLAVALGESGMQIVQKTVGTSAKNWGTLVTSRIPGGAMANMNRSLVKKFVSKYLAKRSALLFGKLLPAGIGAVIGGAGNRAIGKGVIRNARDAFGPPPAAWPESRIIEPD